MSQHVPPPDPTTGVSPDAPAEPAPGRIKRWSPWIALLLLLLAAGWVWNREQRLLELQEKEARLNRDLQWVVRQNRQLRRNLETLQELDFEIKCRHNLEATMSRSRSLPFRHPVRYQHMQRAGLKNYILSKLGSQYSPEEFKNYEMALQCVGLLPRQSHLITMITDLLSEQVAAFYDPDTHELYTFARLNLKNNFERMILAHELIHALQDQNFHLSTLPLKAKNNDDAALAAAALVEGDANYHMGMYLLDNYHTSEIVGDLQLLFSQKTDKVLSAPPYLQDSLLFPYREGQRFVAELHTRGGNKAVNAAFPNPPQSSEQVLHPEKYFGPHKDAPQPVRIDITVDRSWKKLHENVAGELGIRSLFSQLPDAEKAAAGWGGDRYVLYKTAVNQWALLWKTVWDTKKDAREFFDALESFYRRRYETAEPLPATCANPERKKNEPMADSVFFSVASQKQSITLRGNTVWFLSAPDTQTIKLLLSKLNAKN